MLVAKELEILKEALPHAKQVGVLWTPTAPSHAPALKALEAAAENLEIQLLPVPARALEDFDAAFSTLTRARVDCFLAVSSPLFYSQRAPLAELVLKYRLAGMFGIRDNAEAGGLMSYSADLTDLVRRAATYIDKILKGARPADLAVEQASQYRLVINLKTAKALGITIPPSLVARADGRHRHHPHSRRCRAMPARGHSASSRIGLRGFEREVSDVGEGARKPRHVTRDFDAGSILD